ncbi:MAG TPA: rhodanese-like domain-containing protein [Longimicrobiales bacterium]
MFLEMIEAEGLAHLSYVFGDEEAGVCAVVDPRRDIDAYLAAARRHRARITAILETHIPSDFVSGSRELAARTGAPLYVGAGEYGFAHRALHGGESIPLGRLRVRVLAAPGHTPEHVCYVVTDGAAGGAPVCVFTGDTLLRGEVGRPEPAGVDAERLARALYRTLHHALLLLGDDVVVYPGRGRRGRRGGRTDGGPETTIGDERRNNPRLAAATESEFVAALLASTRPTPTHYARLRALNARGPDVVGHLPNLPALDPHRLRAQIADGQVMVIDARGNEAYAGAHIAGALNLALRSPFPLWAGWLLDPAREIVLVVERPADIETVRRHLYRIGHDAIGGRLRGGMHRWIEAGLPFRYTAPISVHELRERIEDGEGRFQLVDVRCEDEWADGRIPGARNIPLPALVDRPDTLDRGRPVVVYAGAGYRASIAVGILERGGFQRVRIVPGGMLAWRAAGFPVERGAAS